MIPASPLAIPATITHPTAAKADATPTKNVTARPIMECASTLDPTICSAVRIDAGVMEGASVLGRANRVLWARGIVVMGSRVEVVGSAFLKMVMVVGR